LLTALQKHNNTDHDAHTATGFQDEDDPPHSEPREKTINTTEILEGILECLPLETLFMLQRAKRRFHETIINCPRLRRKMFLRIENDRTLVWEAHIWEQEIGVSSKCMPQ
jgi:hypothetical protein